MSVDISPFFASPFPRSVDHEQAPAVTAMLRTAERQLITTNFIMAELHALAFARSGRTFASGLLGKAAARISIHGERRARESRAYT